MGGLRRSFRLGRWTRCLVALATLGGNAFVQVPQVRGPRCRSNAGLRRTWPQELRTSRSKVARGALDGVAEFMPLLVALAPSVIYHLAGEAKDASPTGHSGKDATTEVMELLSSDVLSRIRKPLVFLNVVSAAAFAFNFYILPPGRANFVFPVEGFVALTFCVAVLLGHRLKTANQRFLRGQKAWSEIVNVTRNLNRQAHLWTDRESFLLFARWLPAFPSALLWDLRQMPEEELVAVLKRSQGPGDQAASGGLTSMEMDQVLTRPPGSTASLYVLQKLHVIATKLQLADRQSLVMQQALCKLLEAVDACEKEKHQALPLVYQYCAGTIFLWLALLPFILPSQLQVGIVLAQQVLAFGLLGIEDVIIQLEEPFTVLQMEGPCASLASECQALRSNWRRMRKGLETPKPKEPPQKYSLGFPKDDRIFPCYPDETEAGSDDEVILLK